MSQRRKVKPRRKVHDLRSMYGTLPGQPDMVALVTEEPNGLLSSDEATLEIGTRRDGMSAHPRGAKEWVPPQRPTIVVVQSVRGDPLGRMFARHQISRVRYDGGRRYQEIYEASQIRQLQSSDPSRPYIEGGRVSDPITDRQRAASAKLRALDRAIACEVGYLGLAILHVVLVECLPLVAAGERTGADKGTRSFLLNAALTTVAIKLGLATAALRHEDAAGIRSRDPTRSPS
jgi:hypothetical protein